MGHTPRRPQATPSAKRILQRNALLVGARFSRTGGLARGLSLSALEGITSYVAGLVGVRGLRLALNTAVAVLVLSLPFAATAATRASTDIVPSVAVSAQTATDAGRAQPAARGGTISASRNPVTANAEGARPIQQVTVHEGDTLATMANFYDVSVEAMAFANGISDSHSLQIGQNLRVPPAEGALYTVADGDTVDSVAVRFKVDPSVIMSYNRLYFEPEHFGPGQLIFVRGAQLPALRDPVRVATAILAGPSQVANHPRFGSLSWPVAGVITQYFWWGHTGTDVAAPYGTGIGASDDGVVTATGWVAVGGLRVCVQHAGNLQSCYYHTSAVYVSVGQQVARGQTIAAIGLTGVTTGPHVHWECKQADQFVDCLSL